MNELEIDPALFGGLGSLVSTPDNTSSGTQAIEYKPLPPPPSREEFETLLLRLRDAETAIGENIKLTLFLWKAIGAKVEFVDSGLSGGKALRDA